MSSVRVRLGPPLPRNDFSPPEPPDEAAFDTALTHAEAPSLAHLAGRWGVSRDTARFYGRQEGFPAPLVLTARRIRWPAAEVAAWDRSSPALSGRGRPLRQRVGMHD